jgi:hypothetical protein
MNVGYFENAPGSKSMGRLLAFIVVVVAMAIALTAAVLVVASFVRQETEIVGSLVLIITGAFGVASIGEVMKNWAKKIESSNGGDGSGSASA